MGKLTGSEIDFSVSERHSIFSDRQWSAERQTDLPFSQGRDPRQRHLLIIQSFLNAYLTNGLSHHYQLGESTFISRGVWSEF